jgi:hypothetical protein
MLFGRDDRREAAHPVPGHRMDADAHAERAGLGPGKPLDPGLLARLSPRFGADLAAVRIHDDAPAAALAGAEGARAVTIGRHVAFGGGEYRPGDLESDAITAHEVAHAQQQRNAFGPVLEHAPDAGLEGDADRSALAALTGGAAGPRASSGLRLSRCDGKKGQQAAQQPVRAAGTTPSPVAEDWNFTPAEYAALVKGHGQLQMAVDSGWFPPQLQANLLALLNYVLDPNLTPSSTSGVNVKDLYHGHVALPKATPIPPDLRTKMNAFEAAETKVNQDVFGKDYPDVTAANVAKYAEATVRDLLPAAKAVLEQLLKVNGAVVVYHSFEDASTRPGMKVGDPRRNIMVPLDTNKPVHFTPPDENNASTWMRNYTEILQFSFLVDAGGKVHVRTGSTSQLSTVTGKPEQ